MPKHIVILEGVDDKHVVQHVLTQRGLRDQYAHFDFSEKEGWDPLIESLPVYLKSQAYKSIAVVADADSDLAIRWGAIRRHLEDAGYVDLPIAMPQVGVVADAEGKPRVGVWLMPNNQGVGAMEDFLLSLVDDQDPGLVHAKAVIRDLPADVRKFRPTHEVKALVHTWLAWQESPGLRLGTAVKARYFDANREAAGQLVDWFSRVDAPL